MRHELYWQARWYYLAAKSALRSLWDALPGPWYVKVLLIVVTQLIPGPQDEILLIAITALWRARKQRKVNHESARISQPGDCATR